MCISKRRFSNQVKKKTIDRYMINIDLAYSFLLFFSYMMIGSQFENLIFKMYTIFIASIITFYRFLYYLLIIFIGLPASFFFLISWISTIFYTLPLSFRQLNNGKNMKICNDFQGEMKKLLTYEGHGYVWILQDVLVIYSQ